MNIENQKDIIGAMFHSDGSIKYYPNNSTLNIEYYTISNKLAYQLSIWLHINHIDHSITKDKPTGLGTNDIFKIRIFARNDLTKINFIGEQKKTIELFINNVSKTSKKKIKNKVTKIYKSYINEIVYDFGLEDSNNNIDHLFLAGSGCYISNCRSWDLRKFFFDGFSPDSEDNAITAAPPKHAEVAILQATKALAMGQCNHAGGQGLLYGTVFLAPYMKDKTYKEIKQLMQMMMYELNQMYISRGGQVIFSSINVSPGCPKVLENIPVVYAGMIYDGKENRPLWTYGELEREIRLQFQALMEISLEGDATGKLFPFPKIEIAIEKKFTDIKTWKNKLRIIDELDNNKEKIIAPSYEELYLMAFNVTAKYGILYFDNLLPESKDAENSVGCTQCCSYSFKTDKEDTNFEDELYFRNGRFFRLGGMQAGSINLPRLAIKANHSDKVLIAQVFDMMDLLVEMFKEKKNNILRNKHRLKYLTQKGETTQSLTDFNKLVYEIGIVGLNEMCQYHTGKQLDEGQDAIKLGQYVLAEMKKYCKILSEMHEMKIVLARTPAETVAQKFAVCDILDKDYREKAQTIIKGDLETAIEECKSGNRNLPIYYSNGFAPFVGSKVGIFEKIRIEDKFWQFVDGGAITHIWLGEQNPDPKGLMEFAMNIFKNTNIGYLAFTKDLSQCIKCKHIMTGLLKKCNNCGGEDLNWFSRITGYYALEAQIRNGEQINNKWNAAKTEELKNREKVKVS